ncbi:MAG TPA: thioredoxin domain-containing protein [Polyangiaceae bacterium]
MWIHRLARLTTVLLVALQVAGCATPPASAPLAKPATASGPQPLELATRTNDHAPQPSSDALPVSADDAVWGSPTAPVTILEFSDLQCPFCARVHPTVKQLETKYGPNQLRIVFKHNPLPFHPNARPAAKIADAVLRQGGSRAFFAFLDLAFAEQPKLSDEALTDWITRVGLDATVVIQRAELQETADKIDRDVALAGKIGANGTPAFRINGSTLVGAQPIDAFTSIIDAELAATSELLKKGTPPNALYGARVAANFTPAKPETNDEPEEDLSIWKMPVKGAPVLGAKDALVTIVEFFDYQCPYCRRVEATIAELLTRYPKDLRVVLRQNPLPFHARALPAANLALEARAEKGDAGFLDANRALFSDAHSKLEDADLLAIGKQLKLDEKRLQSAITSNTHSSEIEADADLASDFKASGTPYFFINGMRLSGAQPIENFVTAIDAQLKVASSLVAAGTPRAAVYDEIMKRAKEPDAPEQKTMPAPTAENPTRGPANAPIVIHEFADFQCPFCGRVETTLSELEKAFPGKLRWVWHDYPLPFHEHARPAALVAREARAEKGDTAFWKIHDLMFKDQGIDGALGVEMFAKYARELQLDPARLSSSQSDGHFDSVLEDDQKLAQSAGINGTPAFVINGYYLSGAQPLSAFKRLVRYALAHPQTKPAQLAAPAKH